MAWSSGLFDALQLGFPLPFRLFSSLFGMMLDSSHMYFRYR